MANTYSYYVNTSTNALVIELPYEELYLEASNDFKKNFISIISDINNLHLIIDFKNVSYINSYGIGAFLEIWHVCNEKKRNIICCNIKPHIQELFRLTNMTMFFDMVPSIEDAISKSLEPIENEEQSTITSMCFGF